MPPPLLSSFLRTPNRRRHARAPSTSGSGGRGAPHPYESLSPSREGYAFARCTLVSCLTTRLWGSVLTTPLTDSFRLDIAGGSGGGGTSPAFAPRRDGGIAYDGKRVVGRFKNR
ncbi:hypothetical protein FB107DRAFT_169235, partial [Schizophyllum commune]